MEAEDTKPASFSKAKREQRVTKLTQRLERLAIEEAKEQERA